jgi:hypothetical protein
VAALDEEEAHGVDADVVDEVVERDELALTISSAPGRPPSASQAASIRAT